MREKTVSRLPNQYSGAFSDNKPSVLRNKKVKHLGSGAFASTYSHQDRREDVRKITKPQSFQDGYWKYVKALAKHSDNGNPYFPKFREGTSYRNDEEGSNHTMLHRSVLAVKTERLQRLEKLTVKEIESGLVRWFGEDWQKDINYIYGSTKDDYDLATEWYRPVGVLVDIIKKLHEGTNWIVRVKDQDLIRAVSFIKNLCDKQHVSDDYGTNNIMYKRSPYGIQLVFTDPVA